MRNENKEDENKTGDMFRKSIVAVIAALFCLVLFVEPSLAQKKGEAKGKGRVGQFIDEDGDGFNDLMPDDDGDGIPNAIDPDFKGHSAESLYMHRYMYGQSIEAERNRFQQENHYGEPGQYGPRDSTGHGQGDGRGGHRGNSGSGNEGDGDGGGQSGQGGSGDHGGGNGKLAGGSDVGSAGSDGNIQQSQRKAKNSTTDNTGDRRTIKQSEKNDKRGQNKDNSKRSGNQNKKGGR